MSTILITGGTGFVGGRMARKLAETHKVVVSSRLTLSDEVLQAHGAGEAVLHSTLLQKEGFPTGVDTVIHMAALNEWDCVKFPSEAIRVNIDESRILLENAISAGVKQFIYFSTAHIYGSPLKGLITEDTLPVPAHPYAITHKAAEDYIIAAILQKRIKGTVIRLSNSFGAPVLPTVNRWTLLANDLARQAIENKRIQLVSNGCQYRDFICLDDVERVISRMVIEGEHILRWPIYNLGSGTSMKVIDFATAVAMVYQELFGEKLPVVLPAGAVPTAEPELHYSVNRLLTEGYELRNDIYATLKELLIFCSQHFSVKA